MPLHAGEDGEYRQSDDDDEVFHSSVAQDLVDSRLEAGHLQGFWCHSHCQVDGARADDVRIITRVGVVELTREVVISEPSRHCRCYLRLFSSLFVSYWR